ncbi:hypothetical protein [Natronospora cellulosivora (SeqCode)]
MIITCDSSCNMGYFYLMPPAKEDYRNEDLYDIFEKRAIRDGRGLMAKLDKMEFINAPYHETIFDLGLIEDYQNDMTEDDYMLGVELELSYAQLMKRVKGDAFNTYTINWQEDDYYLFTLNNNKKVFDDNNFACPMNDKKDTFLILSKDKKQKLNFLLDEGSMQKVIEKIVLVEGFITKRTDLYSLEYLSSIQCRV